MLIVKEERYPFAFFCEERYSEKEVVDRLDAIYEHIIQKGTDIIGIDRMHRYFRSEFCVEFIARMLIKNEYSPASLYGIQGLEDSCFVSAEEIKQYFESLNITVNEFLKWIENRMTSMMSGDFYGETGITLDDKMLQDIQFVLLKYDFFFADCDDYTAIRNYERWSNKKERKSINLYHTPIRKVW